MKFKFADKAIEDLKIDLEILQKDANNYSMLLFQNISSFSIAHEKYGNKTDATSRFSSFLELANTENASIAITPEYSCPWDSIINVINNQDKWPKRRKLWALGCESIKPHEIKSLQQDFSNDDIHIYYDETALDNGPGSLLDPLCYIFRGQINENEKLIILVQFKTLHMGVWADPIEREQYIPGNEVYILRNEPSSIYLLSSICSGAANFAVTEELKNAFRWDEHPYIILNPQMNPKPAHEVFKAYRKSILMYPNKDIVSLNWGGGTKFAGNDSLLIKESKSSISFKTSDVDFQDEDRFIRNHDKGLYYLNRKKNSHVYYLNPNVEVFLITNQKPSAAGIDEALIRRTGPEIIKLLGWQDEFTAFQEITKADDKFEDYLNEFHCVNPIFHDSNINFIDKERLVNLSCGKAQSVQDDKRWYTIDKLDSFVINENEDVKRFTYVFDTSGSDARRNYLDLMDCLNDTILKNPALFPECLLKFKENCDFVMFYRNGGYNYKYNLVTNDGLHKATVAYIGRNPKGEAQKTFRRMQKLFESDDQAKKRVVVWYKINENTYSAECDENLPNISDDPERDPNSIS